MPREIKRELKIMEPMTLGDLRWLVQESAGLPDTCQVTTTEYRYIDPREYASASITVHGVVTNPAEIM